MVTYTKNDVAKMFKISRTTLYRHMEKNNIDKNSKLSDKEIAILKQSIRPTLTLDDENMIGKEEHSKLLEECKEAYEMQLCTEKERLAELEQVVISLSKQNELLVNENNNLQKINEKLNIILEVLGQSVEENIEVEDNQGVATTIEFTEDHLIDYAEQMTLDMEEELGTSQSVEADNLLNYDETVAKESEVEMMEEPEVEVTEEETEAEVEGETQVSAEDIIEELEQKQEDSQPSKKKRWWQLR